ncbi:MAG: methionine adenosyltransferase domain-containing protein, partial [Nanoarchaeota archaeon]
IAVDSYGPQIPIGGGAFSGKDSTKVDRSGAYMARKIAVRFLKASGAKEIICKLAYVIGIAKPVMVSLEVDGHNVLGHGIETDWDLTPKGMIDLLDLRKPQFEKTAQWGHFGNNFLWDK